MKRFVFCFLALLSSPIWAEGIAIVDGRVHTLTAAGVVDGATVLVRDGVIEAVGADIAVPAGYTTVSALGRIVTPGLIDAYTQLGLQEIGGEAATRDDAVAEYPFGPALDVQYAVNPASTLLPINLVEGVTRAVTAPRPGNDPLAGWGATLDLAGNVTDVRVAMFGSFVSGDFTGGSRAAMLQRVEQALAAARRFNASRYAPDAREYRRADMEALAELVRNRLPLVLEVHRAVDILRALELADRHALPLVVLGGSEAWQVANPLADADVPVILDVAGNLPVAFDRLGARLDNAALLNAAGVTVVITAEETHNARLLRQFAGTAVAYGMPWDAALAAITANPASVFPFPDGAGRLEAGGVADLVVWSGDPLEVTTWAERVMLNGEWVDQNTRQTQLFNRYRDLTEDPYGYR